MIQMPDELRYATNVAATMDAVVVTDGNGKIILFNKYAEKLFGYRQQDIVGHPLDILIPPETREIHKLHVSKFIQSRDSGRRMAERRTVHGLHANGNLIVVEASIYQTSVRGNNYCTAILRDVSPIRETEALLRKKTHELEQYLRHYKNELNATQTRLSEVQRLSQTGIWDLDIEENTLYWSDEVYDIFEIDKSRFGASYDAFLSAVHPDDRKTVDKLYQKSVKTRTPYQVRHRLLMNDGRIKYVDERGETYYNDSGNPIRSVGTIQDITSQITTDQQRRNLQNLLLRAETMAEIGSWEWNLDSRKLYWSPELYRQYGVDQTIVPEPDFDLAINLVHPEDREKVRSIFNNALTGEFSDDHVIEYRIYHPSGEIRHLRSQGQVIKNDSGIPIFLYGIVKDITHYVRAESQIRKSNQLLEAVFDTVHVCIAYLDRNMNFIRVNRPYAEIAGKEPEYFIGKNHFDLYPNKENETIFKNAVVTGERVVFNAKPFEYEYNPERGITHWDWTLTPVKDDSGTVSGLVLSLLEVSERINAIEALQKNEEQLRSLNENLEQMVAQRTEELQEERNFIDTVLQIQGALVIVLDRTGNIIRFNRACEETSGYGFDEVRGKPVWNFVIPPEECSAVKNIFDDLTNTALPSRFENHWIDRHGDLRLIEWSNSTLTDSNGIVRYVIATGIDVTDRRQTETRLRQSESSLRQAQRIAKLGSWEWNITSGDLWWSHEIYRIFGRRPGEFKPSHETFVSTIHPDDVYLVKQSEQNAMKTGFHDVIHRIITLDGETRVVHECGEVEYDESGNPQIMRGTVHDITEIKQAEEERNQLQRQLQQAQKMESIGHLTGGIAHDFNNILSSILGFTHLALARFAPDRQGTLGEYLTEIDKAGKRASDLVKQLLAFSRGDNQKQVVLNPNYIIKESVQMLRPMIPTSININYRNTQDSDIHIYTDALQLQQTIINLVINARDALNGKGNITIKLSTHDLSPMECTSCHKIFSGNYAAISVIDDGSGIGEEYLVRIFEPFFTTKDIGLGSGMGLAMVHGFIHASNGHILVDSKPDAGTSIQMYFPLCPVNKEAADSKPTARNKKVSPHTAPVNILVVDDEPTITRLLSNVLELAGYKVDATTSSSEALSMIEKEPTRYDILITDQSMPELTGIELVNNVRKLNSPIPIILCSGYSENINESNCKNFSITRYLNKPIDHDLLIQTIQELTATDKTGQ